MVVGRVASSVVQRQVKYVTPVPVSAATGLVAQVYQQVADDMRLVVPPALLHSPVPDTLAAYWVLMRESLLCDGVVDRATKEAVAATVSIANICPYCADLHSVSMYELSGERDAEAVSADRLDTMADPHLRAVTDWARHAHQADPVVPLPAGYSAAARAELVGVVVCLHYLTRMVNVFLANFLLPPGLGPRTRRRFKRGVSRVLRPTLRDPRPPGRSLRLLPPGPALPAADRWALASPATGAALSRVDPVFEAAGALAVPPAVREVVLDHLASWRGEETGISTAWSERLSAGLSDADRATCRLALLTAFASHQVEESVVGEFRRYHPGDATLVRTVAWASFAAARTVGRRQGTAAHDGRRNHRAA